MMISGISSRTAGDTGTNRFTKPGILVMIVVVLAGSAAQLVDRLIGVGRLLPALSWLLIAPGLLRLGLPRRRHPDAVQTQIAIPIVTRGGLEIDAVRIYSAGIVLDAASSP